MVRRALAFFLMASVAAQAAEARRGGFAVDASTAPAAAGSTPRQSSPLRIKKVVPQHIRRIPRDIQKVLKGSGPNPGVESPNPEALPVQAPPMPEAPTPDTEPLPSGANRMFDVAARVMTKTWKDNVFVWLPAISTDPNAGPTYGIMPVLVLAQEATRRIEHLLAPSATHNSLFGATGTLRYYWYPTADSQMFAYASYSKQTNRDFKLRYINPSMFEDVLYLHGEVLHSVDGSKRFFGVGPDSRESDEAGYTFRETGFRGSAGVNFLGHMRTTTGFRFMTQETRHNIIPELPDAGILFSRTPGFELQQTAAWNWQLLWDSRDIAVTPSRGTAAAFYIEQTASGVGSDADFFRHGIEVKQFVTWNAPRHLSLLRGIYERVLGSNTPFYELASLGGRETLRGYGDGRFLDTGRFALSAEHRWTFAKYRLMGIETNFELAPFVDVGTVFPRLRQVQRKDMHLVGGMGFRAAVKPNVVGDVEVGVGREGAAVFVDINYPF